MKNILPAGWRSPEIDWMAFAGMYLSGVLGALTIHGILYLADTKTCRMGTVNITAMVDQFARQESAKILPPEKIREKVSTFGKILEEELKKFSSTHHLILLPQEAVIAGSEDYTKCVRAEMDRAISRRKLPDAG